MQNCISILLPFLLQIYNASLTLGCVPTAWKRARVIALRKPEKETYSVAKSCRPISLLSILGKTLESIVHACITRVLEGRGLLSQLQLGFRKGREAIDGGWRLTHEVIQALQTRQQVQAITFHIQSAYDTVWHEGLLERCSGWGWKNI